ncbi:MAG: hypothetical protein VX278_00765 [Myxococcota bacterium]|nr:hypothetical protein [Myxococcota bacterium]
MQMKNVKSVLDEDALRLQLTEVIAQVALCREKLYDLKPKNSDLKWFGKGRYQAQASVLYKSTQDVLNHASTMIGYFDGFEKRGAFQELVAKKYPIPDVKSALELHSFMDSVLAEAQSVFVSLLARDSLQLSPAGPSKPGPRRTMQVCSLHLESLEGNYLGMLIAITRGVLHKKALAVYQDRFKEP